MNKRNFLKLFFASTVAVSVSSNSWWTGKVDNPRAAQKAAAGAWLKSCGIVNQQGAQV